MTAAARTSGRLSMPTTASRRDRSPARSSSAIGMSAPPVPTSSSVSCVAVRGERVDRVCAQPHAAEPAVDPAQVAQVAGQRRRVVERTVEKLDGIGAAVHRGSVRRARTMGRMIVVAGEALIDLLVQPDGRVTAVPGGGPFNTARTIGRLGGEVAFLGRLSTDRFGGILRDGLTESRGRPSLDRADRRADHAGDRRARRRRCRDVPVPHDRHIGGRPVARGRRGRPRDGARERSISGRSVSPSNRWRRAGGGDRRRSAWRRSSWSTRTAGRASSATAPRISTGSSAS